MYLISLSSL